MGTCYINGIAIPEPAPVFDERAAAWAAEDRRRAIAARANFDAMLDDIARRGRRAAGVAVKQRARHFCRHPEAIDVFVGLTPASTPNQIVALASIRLEQERAAARRWSGMGGDSVAINCHGALLYARYLRRLYRVAGRLVKGAA